MDAKLYDILSRIKQEANQTSDHDVWQLLSSVTSLSEPKMVNIEELYFKRILGGQEVLIIDDTRQIEDVTISVSEFSQILRKLANSSEK